VSPDRVPRCDPLSWAPRLAAAAHALRHASLDSALYAELVSQSLRHPPRPDASARAKASSDAPTGTDAKAPQRTVKANYSNHLWNIDLSLVPTGAGLWTVWLPFALPQCWPFAWWVGAVVDHYSRHVIEIEAYHSHPSEAQVCALLDRAVATAGRPPKYTVTDQGGQFGDGYRAWCKQHGIRPRFGAVGKSGSIALIERFMLTLKNECHWPRISAGIRRERELIVGKFSA
jgi:transposase InsO family protein